MSTHTPPYRHNTSRRMSSASASALLTLDDPPDKGDRMSALSSSSVPSASSGRSTTRSSILLLPPLLPCRSTYARNSTSVDMSLSDHSTRRDLARGCVARTDLSMASCLGPNGALPAGQKECNKNGSVSSFSSSRDLTVLAKS